MSKNNNNQITIEIPESLQQYLNVNPLQNNKNYITSQETGYIDENDSEYGQKTWSRDNAYQQIVDKSYDLSNSQKQELRNWINSHNFTAEEQNLILNGLFGDKYGINKNNIVNSLYNSIDNSDLKKYGENLADYLANLGKNYTLKSGDITNFLNGNIIRNFAHDINIYNIKNSNLSDKEKQNYINAFNNYKYSDNDIDLIIKGKSIPVYNTQTIQVKSNIFDKYDITNKDTKEKLKSDFKISGFDNFDSYMQNIGMYKVNSDGTFNPQGYKQYYNSQMQNLTLKESIPKLRQSLISNIQINNPLSSKNEIEKINQMSDDEIIDFYNKSLEKSQTELNNIQQHYNWLKFTNPKQYQKEIKKARQDWWNGLTDNQRYIINTRNHLNDWNNSWMSWVPGLNTIAQAGFAGTLHGLGDPNWSDVGTSALTSLGIDTVALFAPLGKIGQSISKTTAPVRSAINKFAETAAGKYIIAVPRFGYNMGKYMIQHPIESFVLPKIIRDGMESGYNYLENTHDLEISPEFKNATEIGASVLIPGMGMNFLRNKFGVRLYDSVLNGIGQISSNTASKLSNSNNFRNLFFSDLGYTRSGALPSLNWNNLWYSLSKNPLIQTVARKNLKSDFKNLVSFPALTHVFGRRFVPETLNAIAAGSQAYLPNGSITNTLQTQYGLNPILADITDFGANMMLSHAINKGTNMFLNQPIMVMKQLSGGAQTQYTGFSNFIKNLPNMKIRGWNHFVDKNDNSYQLIYNRTTKQIERNISKNAAHTTKNSESDNLETLMGYDFKNLKIGDKILNDRAIVSGIIPSGTTRVNNDFSTELGRQLNNKSGRYQKGQDIRIIKTTNSEELPSLKEMSKSGEWEALAFDGNPNIQIKEGVEIPMQGVYGDFKLNTNLDGSATFLNSGGHQLSLIKNKRTGEIYAVETDLSGTGSTTRGSDLSIISDSAQFPYVLSKVTKINPNIPIEKQLGLMSVANRTELSGTLGMITNNLFNFKNLKIFEDYNGNNIWFPNFKQQLNFNVKRMNSLNKEYKNTILDYKMSQPKKSENYIKLGYSPVEGKKGYFWKPFTINDRNVLRLSNEFNQLKTKLNQIIQNNI